MKKFLLLAAVFASASLAKLNAQCTLSNLSVNLTSANSVGGNCQVTLNVAFDIAHNNGNKKIWINLWKPSDYSALAITGSPSHPSYLDGAMPTLDALDGPTNVNDPVAIIGINNDASPVTYFTSYSADASHISIANGNLIIGSAISVTTTGGLDHFILTGLTFTSPGSCSGLVLQGDIWSTQANASTPPIQCFSNGISFFGDPTISGQITCAGLPKQFQVILHTVSVNNMDVNYKVYIDNGPVGRDASDALIYTSGSPITISSASSYTQPLTTWSGDQSRNLVVDLNVLSPFTKSGIVDFLTNTCATLPVKFKSFTAERNHSTVSVKWVTASEQNNHGFEVERQLGTGQWQTLTFVPSQSSGFSNGELSYSYNDVNTVKGIANYRIRQVDNDGKSTYSVTRSVRSEDQPGKTLVYPNPTMDGSVKVVFEDKNGTRDVSLMDMNGKVVKQWNGIANNNISIDNLTPGIYSLRVILKETGAQTIEKIVVNKR